MPRTLVCAAALLLLCGAEALGQKTGGGGKPADPLVRTALESENLKFEVTSEGNYRLIFNLDDGRSQLVIIQSKIDTYRGLEMREVWSPAYKIKGPLPAETAQKLLVDSSQRKLGAWQVMESDGTSMAVFSTRIPWDSKSKRLYDTMLGIIEVADAMEKELTNADEY